MWLSRKNDPAEDVAVTGEVTAGGEKTAVLAGFERRGVTVYGPGGYVWRPEAGQKILVIKCADGTAAAGAPVGEAPAGMKGGEVYIKSGGASVWLKNNGDVAITGNVKITGSLSLNGNAVS